MAGNGYNADMLDTLDVAQSLRDVQFPDAQAAAIAKAVGQASEHGDHVTRDQFKSGISELRLEVAVVREGLREEIAGVREDLREEIAGVREGLREEIAGVRAEVASVRAEVASVRAEVASVRTEVANVETRLIRWLVGVVLGAATLSVAAVAALLRFWLAGG